VVEAQFRNSTRKLTESDEEQALLEELIDAHAKPPVPPGLADLHFLLSTPFRHPPLRNGSRFGTRQERGILYGARELPTAFAEVAYYRLLFLEGTAADLGTVTVELTAFSFGVSARRAIDLTRPPFARFEGEISSKTSYATPQQLGREMREDGVDCCLYTSARAAGRGVPPRRSAGRAPPRGSVWSSSPPACCASRCARRISERSSWSAACFPRQPLKGGRMPTVELAEVTLELDDQGLGDPVLLLHGFPASRRLWSGVAPLLVEAGHRAIVPDLAGYGASRAAEGTAVGMANQARWMLELLDRLGLERVAVVAHDVGSAAAQLMLAAAPARLRSLAVLDGVYRSEWAMEAVESIQRWPIADAARLMPVLVRRLGKSLREVLACYAGEEGGLRLIRAARDLHPAETAELRLEQVPALVLWGERDAYLPVDTVARPLAQQLGAELKLLPGGHFLPIDCPAEVAAALRDFLAAGASRS
jgi:pimeloyl-ACP methyl ester carboxylesterase